MALPCYFFHVDLDAFFSSVEQLDHPEYRGKPVIVSGQGKRGVVSTCSYEARRFGVHSAMPKAKAQQLCPHGIFLPPDMHRYHEKSKEVMEVFHRYSADVQRLSIDEAFLDMTGTEKLFGPIEETAKRLKKEILSETGLSVSVGVAQNKYIAKIASGFMKPDGLTIVLDKDVKAFMESLPLKDVWGVGKKTRERLEGAGLKTTKSILSVSENLLKSVLGDAAGHFLYSAVRGIDPGFFSTQPAEKSISNEKTFEHDIQDFNILETILFDLSQELTYRMFEENVTSRTVSIKIRYGDFRTTTAQSTAEESVNDSQDLFQRLKTLFAKKYEKGMPVRLLGAGLQNITDGRLPAQKELFESGREKKRSVEEAVYKLSKKMGKKIVTRARLINNSGKDIRK